MKLQEWFEIYYQILSDFGFDEKMDQESAKLMHKLAGGKLLDKSEIERIVNGKNVSVIGGAITSYVEDEVIITAGKSILRWMKMSSRVPDIHVTDMEESADILSFIQKKGCLLVLHAHGDNIERIRDVIPRVESFVGTTQHRPFNRIYNFGGFTDGDRAVLIAKRFGARRIRLHGFSFDGEGIKGKKLMWAKKILEKEGVI